MGLASTAKEKAALQKEFAETKATLTAEKEAAAATLSAQKATLEGAIGDFNAKKAGCIGMESSSSWTTSPSWTKSEPPCSETRRKCRRHRKRPEDGLDSRSLGYF